MTINCIWEHNGNDTMMYANDFPGAFTRGKNKDVALNKMAEEIVSYTNWCNKPVHEILNTKIIQEKESSLDIADADTDVIFNSETKPLSKEEYTELKALALKSAKDFFDLYTSIPDKNLELITARKTFYGSVPSTANEMYEHTKNINSYYFGEIGICADNIETIIDCRKHGFEILENTSDYLCNKVFDGSYGEQWSLRKVIRRFIWHDRIHAKAMYRASIQVFDKNTILNSFSF